MKKKIKEALIWASSYLKENGIENPYFESQLLLKNLLNITLAKLTINEEQLLTREKLEKYISWVKQRASGYPFAYIVNKKQFMGLDFYVDERVLIPRPETEILVEWAMGYLNLKSKSKIKVVDIGTGSGAIALSLAKLISIPVLAVDLSPKSLEVCKKNAQSLEVEAITTLYQGSLFEPLKENNVKVDLVLSNLPYIPEEEFIGLQREVREHEPYGALIGGVTGLELYRELLIRLEGTLNKGGAIAIEIAYHQGKEAEDLIKAAGFTKTYILKDLAGHPRVVVGEEYTY